ncbi:MAG: hypothetical protein HY714_01375 [Candidatus Omnitrophica bacterium]|nr:hypothetical protein [Candidatus Omnitrophota bacterium]
MANQDSSVTPEKRLLSLIEDGPGEKQDRPQKPKIQWAQLLSPQALQEKFLQAKDRVLEFFRSHKKPINLKEANKILRYVILGLSVILVISILVEAGRINSKGLFEQEISQRKAGDMTLIEGRTFESSLFENPEARNIFIPYGKRTEDLAKQKNVVSDRLIEMTKNLKLTGISVNPADPGRTFCMVEDIEKNITTFLRAGDRIGGLTVQSINSEDIVLEYQGETIELR